jgi:3-oxoacyl-[acyl-carrier protein] reductase
MTASERQLGASMDLRDSVAAVTGASRGIGRAIAEALAAEGARLVLNARTDGSLRPALEALRARGVEVEGVAGDVGDEETATRLVAAAEKKWGRLDLLVNNAGIGPRGLLEETAPADFDAVFRTNVRGPYLAMRAAIPGMRRRKSGTIVNLASLAGVNPVPQRAAYAATKWAVIGLSRSVLQEVRKDGIRVIVVEPGSTLTEFGHDARKLEQADRLVRPEDVAAIVVAAVKLPARATLSEFEIRPTDPPS